MIEEWRPVVGYEGLYEVSNLGRVKRVVPMRANKKKHGYLVVSLFKDGKHKSIAVHRLVAEAFIPNPSGKPQVNHIDECKTNNHVENLEWVTAKENCNWGTRVERVSNKNGSKTLVLQLDAETHEVVAEFPGQSAAARATGISVSCINATLKGRQEHAGGYIWIYKYKRQVEL